MTKTWLVTGDTRGIGAGIVKAAFSASLIRPASLYAHWHVMGLSR